MRGASVVLGLAVFLLNPGFACGSAESEYQYGEAELRAAIEGDWSLEVQRGGTPVTVTFRLEQAAAATSAALQRTPLVKAARACGTRTLVASAGACIDSTEMPLRVSFVDGDDAFASAALSGMFWVGSLVFDVGTLQLALGELRVTAQVRASGSVDSAQVEAPAYTTAQLERIQP